MTRGPEETYVDKLGLEVDPAGWLELREREMHAVTVIDNIMHLF